MHVRLRLRVRVCVQPCGTGRRRHRHAPRSDRTQTDTHHASLSRARHRSGSVPRAPLMCRARAASKQPRPGPGAIWGVPPGTITLVAPSVNNNIYGVRYYYIIMLCGHSRMHFLLFLSLSLFFFVNIYMLAHLSVRIEQLWLNRFLEVGISNSKKTYINQ